MGVDEAKTAKSLAKDADRNVLDNWVRSAACRVQEWSNLLVLRRQAVE